MIGFVEALSLHVGEYSDETGVSALVKDFYSHSWALTESRGQRGTDSSFKVHPTLLCGGTKGKGFKGYLYLKGLQN